MTLLLRIALRGRFLLGLLGGLSGDLIFEILKED
jgi:hypothetical protein